LLQKWKFK